MTTKTVKTRDAATAILRKLGIKARDYSFFITNGHECLVVAVDDAKRHLESLGVGGQVEETTAEEVDPVVKAFEAAVRAERQVVTQAPEEPADEPVAPSTMSLMANQLIAKPVEKAVATKKATAAKKTAAPKKETGDRVDSLSAVARDLILSGLSNADVWARLKDRFSLDDKKKGYPAWYRWQLRSAGQLPALDKKEKA